MGFSSELVTGESTWEGLFNFEGEVFEIVEAVCDAFDDLDSVVHTFDPTRGPKMDRAQWRSGGDGQTGDGSVDLKSQRGRRMVESVIDCSRGRDLT